MFRRTRVIRDGGRRPATPAQRIPTIPDVTDVKQVIMQVPNAFPTATDIEVREIKPRVRGRLKSYGISINGTTVLAADLWAGVMAAFRREHTTLKMMDGYLSAPQDGDNQGLVWFGDLLLDEETSFVLSIYNRSGETVTIDNVLVIEQ